MRHATMALAAVLCLTATHSEAATIAYQFSGVLDDVQGSAVGFYSVGQAFIARFRYDPAMADFTDVGDERRYAVGVGEFLGVEISLGPDVIGSDSSVSEGFVGVSPDRFRIVIGPVELVLANTLGPAFGSLDLPPTLEASQFTEGRITFANVNYSVSGPIDLGTFRLFETPPVPEPSTLALGSLGLGLLGMRMARRGRRTKAA